MVNNKQSHDILKKESEVSVQVQLGSEQGDVIIRFEKSVNWIRVSPEQAVELGEKLINLGFENGYVTPVGRELQ